MGCSFLTQCFVELIKVNGDFTKKKGSLQQRNISYISQKVELKNFHIWSYKNRRVIVQMTINL